MGRALGVLSWPEEPEEGEDGEVDDKVIDDPEVWVLGVKGIAQPPEDGEVDRVGAFGGVVPVSQGLEESSE